MQNPHFGSKIKISKKDVKIYPTNHLQLFCAKNRSKIAKLIIFNQKLKMQKNKGKTILQQHCSWSVQKTAPKNTKYSRNESILKIGHHAKAIAHAKSSLWLKNYNCKKHVKIHSTNHLQLFCAKNRLKKTPNIREMRAFWNSAIMQRL